MELKGCIAKIKRFFLNAVDVVLPFGVECVICKDELSDNDDKRHSLCKTCAKKLPFRTGKYCIRCGSAITDGTLCKHCELGYPIFDKLLSPFEYDGLARKMIIDHKDGNATYLYPIIAKLLADYLKSCEENYDILCYVPSDKRSIRIRGVEHTKKVCEYLTKEINVNLVGALKRVKNVSDQTEFGRAERFNNIKGAFSLSDGFNSGLIKNKSILLYDDVVTTGATVSECTKILKENGAKKVTVLSFARR